MNTDNEWHPCFVSIAKDDNLIMFETMDELLDSDQSQFSNPPRHMKGEYNYNRGQPIIRAGGYEMILGDMDESQ